MRPIRLALISTGAALLFAQAACKPKDSAQTVATDSAASAAAPAPTPPKGSLPGDWQTFTSEQFRDAVASIAWSDSSFGNRRCADVKQCKSTGAWIWANMDAREITPAIAGTGAVIGKMTLEGHYKTAMYQLLPGNFTYYTVVTGTPQNTMNWQIIQVGNSGKSPIRTIIGGNFKDCGHDKSPVAAADWNGCTSHIYHTGNGGQDSAARLKVPLLSGDGEGWLSCSSGCCTLSDTKDHHVNADSLPPDTTRKSSKKSK